MQAIKRPRIEAEDSEKAEAAFNIMKNLLWNKNPKKTPKSLTWIPYCLVELVDEMKKYPCCLCGKLFDAPSQLAVHAHQHGLDENPCAECCFCGRSFNDFVVLHLHHIASPFMHKCNNCFKLFSDFNELNHHCCKSRSKKCRIQTDLICELGCSKQRQFESEQALELHLFSLHGGSMDDDSMNNDAMKFCVMCKGFVNAYRLSLEDHTYFRCTGRHPWVAQNIRGLYKLAKEQSLNLAMIIQLDLESQLQEWKAREALRGQDGLHIKVPQGVSKSIMTSCLASDKKYSSLEPPFLLPPTLTKLTLNVNPQKDTIKLFHLWNNIVALNFNQRKPNEEASEDFGELAAKMYKDVSLRLPQLNDEKKRFKIPPINFGSAYRHMDFMEESMPPEEVLERLSEQLGSMVSTHAIEEPMKNDYSLLSTVGLSTRELILKTNNGHAAADAVVYEKCPKDLIDPSDFVQVQHKS